MLDQETRTQTFQIPIDQHKLLKRVIPKMLEICSEQNTFQARNLLEQGIPLAQAAHALKVLAQAGVVGPEQANQRTVDRTKAEQLLATIGEMAPGRLSVKAGTTPQAGSLTAASFNLHEILDRHNGSCAHSICSTG